MIDRNDAARITQLNAALEAIYFGFSAITIHADQHLAELGYSRVHHRILFFIGRNPDCSVNELLSIMGVSKQYLHRPLQRLIDDGFVLRTADPVDGRIRRLQLSKTGIQLEEKLSGEQRRQIEQVFAEAGPQAEQGWKKVMAILAGSREITPPKA